MFIQEPVIDKNYVPGKIRNTWAYLISSSVQVTNMEDLCNHLIIDVLISSIRSDV